MLVIMDCFKILFKMTNKKNTHLTGLKSALAIFPPPTGFVKDNGNQPSLKLSTTANNYYSGPLLSH